MLGFESAVRMALRAMPKSMTLTSPSYDTMRFGGEMSQCTSDSACPGSCATVGVGQTSRHIAPMHTLVNRQPPPQLLAATDDAAQILAFRCTRWPKYFVDGAHFMNLRDVDVVQLDGDLHFVDEAVDEVFVFQRAAAGSS